MHNIFMKKILFYITCSIIVIISLFFIVKYYQFPLSETWYSSNYIGVKARKNYDGKYTGARTIIKTVDILESSEVEASKIMMDFAVKKVYTSLSDKQVQKDVLDSLARFSDSVRAFEFDLDDDGINEVIGLPPASSFFMAPWGGAFFILKKQGNEYVQIEDRMIYTYQDKIVIFKEKTNGYHHMQFRSTGYPEPKHLIKFDKGGKCFRFYFYKYLDKK